MFNVIKWFLGVFGSLTDRPTDIVDCLLVGQYAQQISAVYLKKQPRN